MSFGHLQPGALVRHPDHHEWGLGQIQTVVGDKVTINFENAGKQVINAARIALDYEGPDPRAIRR